MNCDSRLRPKDRKQTSQVVRRERNAARGRRSVGPRHMHEHGAASACHPGAGVVVDFDDEIVEVVGPPKAVAAVGGCPSKRAVIPSVGGILAPGEVGGDAVGGQQRLRMPVAIGPPPQADQPKSAPRGRAVALEFVGADTPSAEHDRERQRTREQDALGRAARSGPATRSSDYRIGRKVTLEHRRRWYIDRTRCLLGRSKPACSFTPECSISRNAVPG